MRPADLLLEAEVIGDGLQAAGVIGDQHFGPQQFGELSNPMLNAHGRFSDDLVQFEPSAWARLFGLASPKRTAGRMPNLVRLNLG